MVSYDYDESHLPFLFALLLSKKDEGRFRVEVFQVGDGGNSNGELSNLNVALDIWHEIDRGASIPGIVLVSDCTYEILAYATDTEALVDYGSGANNMGYDMCPMVDIVQRIRRVDQRGVAVR